MLCRQSLKNVETSSEIRIGQVDRVNKRVILKHAIHAWSSYVNRTFRYDETLSRYWIVIVRKARNSSIVDRPISIRPQNKLHANCEMHEETREKMKKKRNEGREENPSDCFSFSLPTILSLPFSLSLSLSLSLVRSEERRSSIAFIKRYSLKNTRRLVRK